MPVYHDPLTGQPTEYARSVAANGRDEAYDPSIPDAAAELARLEREVENARRPRTFKDRAADALADEVAVLVQRHVIDSRSPAADALLDYRNPPSSPRTDRLAELERRLAAAEETTRRLVDVMTWIENVAEGEKKTIEVRRVDSGLISCRVSSSNPDRVLTLVRDKSDLDRAFLRIWLPIAVETVEGYREGIGSAQEVTP